MSSQQNGMQRKKLLMGQLSDIDVKLLKVFRRIVECGGMSATELELNISRSVISRHLKDLEIRLGGISLCRRGRAGFALTEEGKYVYDAVVRLHTAMDSFRAEIDELHERMTGHLVIAMGDHTLSNPKARIADALHHFCNAAPEVTLEMNVQSLNEIEPKVMDGSYHVGIVPMHRESSSLVYHELFSEQMGLYCGPRHPLNGVDHAKLTWRDVRKHRYAGLGYHSPNMELARKVGLRRAATGYNQESIATLIASNNYVGFLPDHYADVFVRASQMRRLDNERFRYQVKYATIVRKATHGARCVDLLLHHLKCAHAESPRLSVI